MAHKRTAKRVAAETTLRQLGKRVFNSKTSEMLYEELTTAGYWWDSAEGEWTNAKKPSTSIFQDDYDMPTGVIRLRVMGHTDDIQKAVAAARRAFNVADVSEPYANRKGPGYRVYITCTLQA